MDPNRRLLTALRRATEASQAAKNRSMVPSGLTKAQYNALLMLRRGEAHTASQLATACDVTQQAMSQTVSRLVKAAFMTSTPSPHGGRAQVLAITTRGDACLDLADKQVMELEHALRGVIEPEAVDAFMRNLLAVETAAAVFILICGNQSS